jgi:hypothetical protein
MLSQPLLQRLSQRRRFAASGVGIQQDDGLAQSLTRVWLWFRLYAETLQFDHALRRFQGHGDIGVTL